MMSMLTIYEPNISIAWAKAFLELMETSGGQRHPAIVIIHGLDDDVLAEDQNIRLRLDQELKKYAINNCATVAGTIFPYSMWNAALVDDAKVLFKRYEKAWPGISKCPTNRNGVYFRRLTSYQPENYQDVPVNQLEFIAGIYRSGNHRKSALQASILDPTRDHTNNRQKGFPCMQQVAFTPLENGGLSVTGYYATQYQFEKAYGNYLGLYWLGRFMAKQLGLKLTQVVCMASVLKLGDPTKTKLHALADDLRHLVSQAEIQGGA